MEFIRQLIDITLHLDSYLNELVAALGMWSYAILFLVVFCETGLVVTPILPGDSLLFAVGALAASDGSPLSVSILLVGFSAAAIAGDAANYFLGFHVGPKVFSSERSRLFNKKHLLRTHQFYEKYGGKTIILARFIPIIRTFAPFVAGIGRMGYRRFSIYNITGGVAWVLIFVLGGFFLRNVPGVKENFHIIIVAIVAISILPAVIELLLSRLRPPETERKAEREPVAIEVE
jgi:membrane-associated protein